MKKYALFALSATFLFSGLAFSQTKTITNADLEKYRKKRLAAEKQLRENYRELGFESPAERKKREAREQKEYTALSNRLRAERIERERLRARNSQSTAPVQSEADFIDYQQYYANGYYYPTYRGRRFFKNDRRTRRYRSGGVVRFRGSIGNRVRNRSNFGPSRRLTRQNRQKSRRANRSFRARLFIGPGTN